MGVTVGVGTGEVVVPAAGGLEGTGGVGVPVVVVDAVVGAGVEGLPGVGEGGPVVVSLAGVVFEEVGPELCGPVGREIRAELTAPLSQRPQEPDGNCRLLAKNPLEAWHVAWKGRRPLSWLLASREGKESRAHRSTVLGPWRGGGSRRPNIGPAEIVLTSCPLKPYRAVQAQVGDIRRVPRAPGRQPPFSTGPTCHSGVPSLGCFALVPITLPRTEHKSLGQLCLWKDTVGGSGAPSAAHTWPDGQQLPQCSGADPPCKRGLPETHWGTPRPRQHGGQHLTWEKPYGSLAGKLARLD